MTRTHNRLKKLAPQIMVHGEAVSRLLAVLADDTLSHTGEDYRDAHVKLLELKMLIHFVEIELGWQTTDDEARQERPWIT